MGFELDDEGRPYVRSPYGPRELYHTHSYMDSENEGWRPRQSRSEPVSPSAEDEYMSSLEEDVDDVIDRAGLTEKQRFVLACRSGMRDGRPHTLQEIADAMGITHQSVSELEQAAKRKLERVLFE